MYGLILIKMVYLILEKNLLYQVLVHVLEI